MSENIDHSANSNVSTVNVGEVFTVGYLLEYSNDPHDPSRDIFIDYSPQKIFTDCCLPSRPLHDREGLQDALTYLRPRDTFLIPSIRELGSLQNITELLTAIIITKRASIISIKDHLELHPGNHHSVNRVVFTLLEALNNIDQKDNHYSDHDVRMSRRCPLSPSQKQEAITLARMGVPKTVIASRLRVSRNTIAKYCHESIIAKNSVQ